MCLGCLGALGLVVFLCFEVRGRGEGGWWFWEVGFRAANFVSRFDRLSFSRTGTGYTGVLTFLLLLAWLIKA